MATAPRFNGFVFSSFIRYDRVALSLSRKSPLSMQFSATCRSSKASSFTQSSPSFFRLWSGLSIQVYSLLPYGLLLERHAATAERPVRPQRLPHVSAARLTLLSSYSYSSSIAPGTSASKRSRHDPGRNKDPTPKFTGFQQVSQHPRWRDVKFDLRWVLYVVHPCSAPLFASRACSHATHERVIRTFTRCFHFCGADGAKKLILYTLWRVHYYAFGLPGRLFRLYN